MPKAAHLAQGSGNYRPRTRGKGMTKEKMPDANPKSTIQVTLMTKMTLDQVKEMKHLETYDEAIGFLIREQKKTMPSSAGKFPSGGPFKRDEEEDPYRVPS